MTITQIRYFVQVAENMNFTKAAQQLYVAQQVVSKQVKRLEEELDFPLFVRYSNKVELTESGQILYHYWKNMLAEQQEQINRAQDAMQKAEKHIRIGTLSINILQDRIARAISASGRDNHGLKFSVENLSYRELGEKLMSGELDCILSLEDENKTILTDDFSEIPLMEMVPSLVIADTHPLYRPNVTARELRDTTFYILSRKFSYHAEENILAYCKAAGFEPEKIQYFDDVSSMELALYGGCGVALIYFDFFRNESGHLKSISLELEGHVLKNHFTVAYPKRKSVPLRPFLQYLTENKNLHRR